MKRIVVAVLALTFTSAAQAQCGSGSGLGLFAGFRARRAHAAYHAQAAACYSQSYGTVSYSAGTCATGQCGTTVIGHSYNPAYTYYSTAGTCVGGNCPPSYAVQTQASYTYGSPTYLAPITSTPLPSPQVPPKSTPQVPAKAAPQAAKCPGGCMCESTDKCFCDACPMGHKKNAPANAVPAPPPAPPTASVEPTTAERVVTGSTKTFQYSTADGRRWSQQCFYNAAGVRTSCSRPTRIG